MTFRGKEMNGKRKKSQEKPEEHGKSGIVLAPRQPDTHTYVSTTDEVTYFQLGPKTANQVPCIAEKKIRYST